MTMMSVLAPNGALDAGKMARRLKRIRRTAGQVRDCDLLLERFSGEHAQA